VKLVSAMMETTDEFCFVYSTFPNKEAAIKSARLLIEQKLAACVNIYPPMTSVYSWEGKREEASEVAAFIKTRRSLVDAAVKAAWAIHDYSVPCFVVLPLEAGTPDYLAWARSVTEQPVEV
jgi:periplasmic divalent cation tolerance protein